MISSRIVGSFISSPSKYNYITNSHVELVDCKVLNLCEELSLGNLCDYLRPMTGDRALRPKSKDQYASYYNGLRQFCILIGDYHSLLILLPNAPLRSPSIDISTLKLFTKFKWGLTSEILLDESGLPKKDVLNQNIYCVNEWNAPKNLDQYKAAIKCLHEGMAQDDPYKDFCLDCLKLPEEDMHKGCNFHSNDPHLRRKGDPSSTTKFKNHISEIKLEHSEYKQEGSGMLIPCEVRDIRARLTSSNNIVDLQTYVIILISICLFVRSDESLDMSTYHIIPELYSVLSNG